MSRTLSEGGRGVWRELSPGVRILSSNHYARLQEAVGTGEILTIVYRAGSQPGTKREVVPLRVDRDYLKATCRVSGMPKTFKIEHVEIVEEDAAFPVYNPGTLDLDRPFEDDAAALQRVLAEHTAELDALGWVAAFSDEAITLFRRDPNGTPVPTVEVGLGRTVNSSGALTWAIECRGQKRRSRKLLSTAAEMFMEAARDRAGAAPGRLYKVESGDSPHLPRVSRLPRWLKGFGWAMAAFVLGLALGLVFDARAARAGEWIFVPAREPGGLHSVTVGLIDNGLAGFSCRGPHDVGVVLMTSEFRPPKALGGDRNGTAPVVKVAVDRDAPVAVEAAYSLRVEGARWVYSVQTKSSLPALALRAAASSANRVVLSFELAGGVATQAVLPAGNASSAAFDAFAKVCDLW